MITFVFCQKCNYFGAMNVTLIVHSKLEILLSRVHCTDCFSKTCMVQCFG